MQKDKILLGCHVSMNAPDYYLGSVKDAINFGCTTFMFYTGAPQNSIRKDLSELKIQEAREWLEKFGFDEEKLIVHAPYIINPANATRPDLLDLTKKTLISELRRTHGFNVKTLVLHPGSHVGLGSDVGISSLVKTLDEIFEVDGTDVKIAIETMAGKGKEIGITFEQIQQILSSCKYPSRLGVCLDTCHISDAGYNIHDVDGIIEEFDRVIGLEHLLVIHLNDSKNERGAHKDRHENLGYGYIGFDTLNKFVHHPRLKNIPKILETPYIDDKPPYKYEIEMLKKGEFIDNWKNDLI